jgi:hypothetical protein
VTVLVKLQVGVCYQLACNAEVYTRVCDARTKINYAIGVWLEDHALTHSQSIQPGFIMKGSSMPGKPGGPEGPALSTAPMPPQGAT